MAERKMETGQGSGPVEAQTPSQRDTARRVRATRIVLTDQWLQAHGVSAIDFYIYEGASLLDAYTDAKREMLSLIMKVKGG